MGTAVGGTGVGDTRVGGTGVDGTDVGGAGALVLVSVTTDGGIAVANGTAVCGDAVCGGDAAGLGVGGGVRFCACTGCVPSSSISISINRCRSIEALK